MPTSTSSFAVKARALGHFIDQPQIIQKASKTIPIISGLGIAGLFALDYFQAKPQERKKVALRDALVLGTTAAGTLIGALLFMRQTHDPFVVEEAIKTIAKKYGPHIEALVNKETKSRAEFQKILNTVSKEDANKILPIEEEHEGFLEGLKKMRSFAVVGAMSVLSGFGGGMIANKINKEPASKKVDMIKEGIFQFIANIVLCAIGASIGIAVVNNKWKPVKQKLARFGIIGAGLSLGIVGGGFIANAIGRAVVNPYFEWRDQGKPDGSFVNWWKAQREAAEGKPKANRKVEFWDAILHLDDLPMALALAGVQILEPFIPLFFALSGYRTGIGYRNDKDHGHRDNSSFTGSSQPSSATSRPAMPSLSTGHVFKTFSQHRNPFIGQSVPV